MIYKQIMPEIEPYKESRIDRIEEKKEEGKAPHKPPKKVNLAAALLTFIKNLLGFVGGSGKVLSLSENILKIKGLLNRLTKEDLSEDLDFLNDLAFSWLDFVESAEKKGEDIQLFLNEVYAYPAGAAFTLGYYLTEHAGYKWIPYPFMEIIRNLHEEYQNNPTNSKLQKWISILDNCSL